MHLSSLLNVGQLLSTYGYIGVFLIIFIESGVFFFLPGDSLLFAAGLLAATGYINLALVVGLALVAAYLGNIVGYEIGIHVEKLRRYAFFSTIVRDEHMVEAQHFFERRGRFAILIARFAPGIRTFTPWVAGAARMHKKTFYTWSAIGAVVWVLVMTLAGYFLGRVFPGIQKYLTEAMIAIVLISLLPGVFELLRRHSRKVGE